MTQYFTQTVFVEHLKLFIELCLLPSIQLYIIVHTSIFVYNIKFIAIDSFKNSVTTLGSSKWKNVVKLLELKPQITPFCINSIILAVLVVDSVDNTYKNVSYCLMVV